MASPSRVRTGAAHPLAAALFKAFGMTACAGHACGSGVQNSGQHPATGSRWLTVALLQVFPLSLDVLYSRSPPGAQPVPPSVGSWHAPCDLEYHACTVSFCKGRK